MKTTRTHDYPRVRASHTCPFCFKGKDQGLVACWPCFRSSGAKNCEPRAERVLEAFECRLIERQTQGHDYDSDYTTSDDGRTRGTYGL